MDSVRRIIVAALALLPLRAWARQIPRVAWIAPGTRESHVQCIANFRRGMAENGLAEGRDYVLDVRYADGHYERFPEMAEAALRQDPAVLFLISIPSIRVAQKLTHTVPIVFIAADPVGSELVTSLARPGGNTTGVSTQAEDISTKNLALAREALPRASRIASLFNPGNAGNVRQLEAMRMFARKSGTTIESFAVRAPADLDQAFQRMTKNRPDALLMIGDSMLFEVQARVAALAVKARLPAIAPAPEYGESGWLFAYGTSNIELYRRAATYVKRILAGARPADLPVEQPTKFELVVNLKTAMAIGVKVPHGILLRADKVIE